jgi:pyrroloquinoline quinone biosynthesis protein B
MRQPSIKSTIWLLSVTIGACLNFSAFAQNPAPNKSVELVVLGIAQDAGFPQAACQKPCCAVAWKDPSVRRQVASLGLIDHATGQKWLFDCTPDFPQQLQTLLQHGHQGNGEADAPLLDGIFLTHGHIGHYSGLIHLGREVMGARQIKTYCMPRMENFLIRNGPWSQLVKLENIKTVEMTAGMPVKLNDRIEVTPFLVPHRDEFSETVGFKIQGPKKSVLFLPDIDKWSRWDQSIEKMIQSVDVAYLDGTFFENGEIPGRDMALIPHPFVSESIRRFSPLADSERKKIRFIHFNHTNPVLQPKSPATHKINQAGMAIAVEKEIVKL